MADAAGIDVLAGPRRPAAAVLLAVAGPAWPVVAAAMAAVAIAAVAGDHLQIARLNPAILPEGWRGPELRASLAGVGLTPDAMAVLADSSKASFLLIFFGVAAIAWRRRQVEPAALLVAYFLVLFAVNWVIEPARQPGWAQAPLHVLDACAWGAFLNFFLLFPNNRYQPGWMLWVGIGVPLGGFLSHFITLPGPVPIGIFMVTLLGALAMQVIRYRRHYGPAERQQTRWLVVGFGASTAVMVALLAVGVLWQPAPPGRAALALVLVGQVVGELAFIPLPLAIAVAVTRHRLWEMDRLLNRALLYALLTGGLGAVYVAVAFIAGSRLSAGSGPLLAVLAAVLVAVLLMPARTRVQLAINHAMYGSRDDPYSALSRLGRRLGDQLEPDAVLPMIASTLRDSMRAELVEIEVRGEHRSSVRAGSAPAAARPARIPIYHQGEPVGELAVVPGGGRPLGEPDRRLLADLASQVGVAIHQLRLRSQLQASREGLVMAREEERRRLSRVLHDDLGAILASHKLKVGSIRATLNHDPGATSDQLATLEADLGSAIGRLRQLAYELRPPALDDLGLREGLLALASVHQREGLQVKLVAPDPLPTLAAATELSLYRIVEQSLANAVGHAGARHCVIELAVGSEIVLTITDDGAGIASGVRPGVGISSMRERAEELGGTLAIATGPAGGTVVSARIPTTGAGMIADA